MILRAFGVTEKAQKCQIFRSLTVFLILFGFIGQASANPLNSCDLLLGAKAGNQVLARVLQGQKIHGPEATHFPLDGITATNLELDQMVLEPLLQMAPTSLGKARINHLLKNPFLDVDHIKERQRAMMDLAGNPSILKRLHQQMTSIDEKDSCLLQMAALTQKGGDPGLSLKNASMETLIGSFICGMGPLMATASHLDGIPINYLGLGILYAIGTQAFTRHKLHPAYEKARMLLETGPALAAQLEHSTAKELVQIRQALEKSGALLSALRKIAPRGFGQEIQVGTYTRSVIRTLGYRKLQGLERELAHYFSAWAELEVYMTAAMLYQSQKNSVTLPRVVHSNSSFLEIKEGHHLFQILNGKESVPNDIAIHQSEAGKTKTYILTGPNAGGKTTYMRMITLNSILAQSGFPVFARSMTLSPFQIITSFKGEDSTAEGISTFRAQSNRVAEIFRLLERGRPTLVVLDEILTGTSIRESQASERAVIEGFHESPYSMILLATHDRDLSGLSAQHENLSNIHVTLDGFRIEDGPSMDDNALDVMEKAGVPSSILEKAKRYWMAPQ